MSIEEQAKLLASWLEKNPGSPPPEGVDPEVLEAIYVFKPELAPAANVSVEDILSKVESGPFHSAQADDSSSEREGRVIVLSEERRKKRRLWASIGSLAAAAAVLVIALPQQEEAALIGPLTTPLDQAAAHREPEVPPPPPVEEMAEPELGTVAAPKANADLLQAPAVGNPGQGLLEMASGTESQDLGSQGFGSGGSGISGDLSLERKARASVGRAAAASEPPATAPSPPEADFDEPTDLEEVTSMDIEEEVTSMDFEAVGEADFAEDLEDFDEAPRAASQSRRSEVEAERDRGRLFRRRSQSRAPAEAPSMDDEAAPPQRDGATQNENQAEENALSLEAMEALALPSDYAAPPSNHSPTTSSGIQWMIAEQAHQLLVNKQYSQAISTASAGLVQSNENTAPLSMLHYVTGRASRAMGLDEAARSAFQRAIELNNAR